MASLVEPGFKTTYIKDERVDHMKARAIAELESLVVEQATSAEAAALPSTSAAAAADEPEVPAKRQKKKSLSSYFKMAAKQTAPQSNR